LGRGSYRPRTHPQMCHGRLGVVGVPFLTMRGGRAKDEYKRGQNKIKKGPAIHSGEKARKGACSLGEHTRCGLICVVEGGEPRVEGGKEPSQFLFRASRADRGEKKKRGQDAWQLLDPK